MKTIKRDTTGVNYRINVKKAVNGKSIECMLCNYKYFIPADELGWYLGTEKGCRTYQRAGTTVVSKQELINAIDNNLRVPFIRVNDGFSVRSMYSVYDCDDEDVFKKIGDNNLTSLPDKLYRITIFYWFNDDDEEWEEGKAIIDVIQ